MTIAPGIYISARSGSPEIEILEVRDDDVAYQRTDRPGDVFWISRYNAVRNFAEGQYTRRRAS